MTFDEVKAKFLEEHKKARDLCRPVVRERMAEIVSLTPDRIEILARVWAKYPKVDVVEDGDLVRFEIMPRDDS